MRNRGAGATLILAVLLIFIDQPLLAHEAEIGEPAMPPHQHTLNRSTTSANPKRVPARTAAAKPKAQYQRLYFSKHLLWLDVGAHYWIFNKFQNYYTNLKPVMQTGLLGPRITFGLQRIIATAEFGWATMWVESPSDGLKDKGSGPTERKDLFAGIDFWRDLVIGAGWFSIKASPSTDMGLSAADGANGYYVALHHKVPLSKNTVHGLRYGFRHIFKLRHFKEVEMTGYSNLGLPPVKGTGTGWGGYFSYNYSFAAPLEFYAGIYAEAFFANPNPVDLALLDTVEEQEAHKGQDKSMLVGPQLGLNFKF